MGAQVRRSRLCVSRVQKLMGKTAADQTRTWMGMGGCPRGYGSRPARPASRHRQQASVAGPPASSPFLERARWRNSAARELFPGDLPARGAAALTTHAPLAGRRRNPSTSSGRSTNQQMLAQFWLEDCSVTETDDPP